MQPFSAEPLSECPQCHGAIRRVLQPVGIVFKGSGWYVTDSKKSSSAATLPATNTNGGSSAESAPKAATADSATATSATSTPTAATPAKT